MGSFLQVVAGVLVAVILCGALSRTGKDISMLLSIAVCCMVLVAAVRFLQPIVELIRTLFDSSQLDSQWYAIVLKTVAIGLISQFAGLICADTGNSAMGKAVELLATAAVLWLSIPLMEALLELVQTMMGEL